MLATPTSINVAKSPAYVRMATAARDAGMPADQTQRFIENGYVPLEGMLPFHAAAREADELGGIPVVALGGKRGPGKSHTIMAQVGLDDCQRVKGLKILFLRRVMKSAQESLEDLVRRVFAYVPHELISGRVKFTNGSTILIGGYRDERDIDKYLGIEYDAIVIEEATQISETKKDKISGSCRTSKLNWTPRIYMSTNADGIGLAWFKKTLVEPSRKGSETNTRFFDVSHIRNPFLNAGYHEWLNGLTGALGKAWKEGDWDAFAGMAFPMWDHDRHVIAPHEYEIPGHWLRWRAIDWGKAAPFCCLWFAKNPDNGQIIVYREIYKTGLTDKQQAELILDMSPPDEDIQFTFADPSMWSKKSKDDEFYSTYDEYKKYGVLLTKADNDRLNGKRKVDGALSVQAYGQPGMLFYSTCENTIEEIENLPRDERRPEDVDTHAMDHAYDTVRYGLTNVTRIKEPSKKNNKPLPTQRMRNMSRWTG